MAKVLGVPASEVRPVIAIEGNGVLEVFHAITSRVLETFLHQK